MPKPLTTITDAKAIAKRIGADACVVIAFKGGQVHAASFGADKQKCTATGFWVDWIVDSMGDGSIPHPKLSP